MLNMEALSRTYHNMSGYDPYIIKRVIYFPRSKEKRVVPILDTNDCELYREKDNFFHPMIFPPDLPKSSINLNSHPHKIFNKSLIPSPYLS
jgi:hypothetical protein